MWPMILEYTRDECRQMLRRMELEAYSSVVSALRAQGELSKEKKQILQQLCNLFSITIERHQAEIRRAANDEKLNTIAYNLSKENSYGEWAAEGRRLIPLMPRLVPQNAITSIANVAANIQAAKNESIVQTAAMKSTQEQNKDTTPGKRKRSESGSFEVQKVKVTTANTPLSTQNSKNSKTKSSITTSQAVPASSTSPRVVFMSSSASGLRTLANASSMSTATKTVTVPVSNLTAGASNPLTTAATTRVFSAKATFPQQVVVFPGSSSNQKTITIPFSAQPVKLTQGAASSAATLVYQQSAANAATLKGIPGTFTIQTFKPSQSNKLQAPNLIIMPASKAQLGQVSKPVATIVGSNAKGLTRHLNAKEVKIVTAETGKDDKSSNQMNVINKPSSNVIEIQASGPVLQNIMKSRQLNKDIIDLVQKAVNNGSQVESPESIEAVVEKEVTDNVVNESSC